MPLFSEPELRERAQASTRAAGMSRTSAQVLSEMVIKQASATSYDIFLSHAFADAEVILGLRNVITEMGFRVYVDWIDDPTLNRRHVTPAVAEMLRLRMKQSESLLFATSAAATDSKWMPWELGYFDAFRGRVAILPLRPSRESGRSYSGQEYLGLYPYIVEDVPQGGTARTLWVHRGADEYVVFKRWLAGEAPRPR